MKTNYLVLSLMVSSFFNVSESFARTFNSINKKDSRIHNFSLQPVKQTKKKSKDSIEYNGTNYIPLDKSNPISLELKSPSKLFKNNLGISFLLNDRNQRKLNMLKRKYQGSKVALFYNGKLAFMPTLNSSKDGSIELETQRSDHYEGFVSDLTS